MEERRKYQHCLVKMRPLNPHLPPSIRSHNFLLCEISSGCDQWLHTGRCLCQNRQDRQPGVSGRESSASSAGWRLQWQKRQRGLCFSPCICQFKLNCPLPTFLYHLYCWSLCVGSRIRTDSSKERIYIWIIAFLKGAMSKLWEFTLGRRGRKEKEKTLSQ